MRLLTTTLPKILQFDRVGGEYKLTQVYLTDNLNCRPTNAAELSEPLKDAKTTYTVSYTNMKPRIPITRSGFTISKENAASISLELRSVDEIEDIQDTDGDGKTVYEYYVARDIYHQDFDATDAVLAAEASADVLYHINLCDVQSVVYNGQKQGPKVVYNGEVLQEGVDYIWKDWGDSGGCIEPGEYTVTLFGKGRFAGDVQVSYTIEPAPEPEPEPEPGPEPAPVATASLTFDLAGGTLNGQTGTLVIEANEGDVIEIPAAPTREGYAFEYWQGSTYYPGDKYTVTGDHTFTAVWKQDAPSSGSNEPSDDTETKDTNADGIKSDDAKIVSTLSRATRTATPRTADATVACVPVLLAVASALLAAGTLRRSRCG